MMSVCEKATIFKIPINIKIQIILSLSKMKRIIVKIDLIFA